MKNVLHDHGQESIEGKAEEGGAEREHYERAHALALANKSNSFGHAAENFLLGLGRHEFDVDREQRNDHRDVREPVERETPSGTKRRVSNAADRRSYHSGQVELNR